MAAGMRAIRTTVLAMVPAAAVACSGSSASSDFGGSADAGAQAPGEPPPAGCLSSSECPTGWTCNDFHVCMPPSPGSDAGVPAETELEVGAPIGAQRYVYVAMTAQNKLARIDGETLAVASTAVG